ADDDTLTYVWTDASDDIVGTGALVDLGTMAPGEYTFTLTVSDGFGGVDTDEVEVEVVDDDPLFLSARWNFEIAEDGTCGAAAPDVTEDVVVDDCTEWTL